MNRNLLKCCAPMAMSRHRLPTRPLAGPNPPLVPREAPVAACNLIWECMAGKKQGVNPCHFLTQAKAFFKTLAMRQCQQEALGLMHMARKLPTTVDQDQLLGYCLGLPQKDGRLVDVHGNRLPITRARGMVLHTWTLAGRVCIEDGQ